MLLQFRIYLVALGPTAYSIVPKGSGAAAAQVASIAGSCLLCVLLLFVSGLTLQERSGGKKKFENDGPDGEKWKKYKKWTERTSMLVPMPSSLWNRLPVVLKRTIGFEWLIYVFVPERDADVTKVKSQQQQQEDAND